MVHFNFVVVLIAAVVEWLLGALWYGVLFKKSWRAMTGLAEGDKPKNAIFGFIVSFVAGLLVAVILALIVESAQAKVFTGGAKLGVICWSGFVAPVLFAQHIWEGRRVNLFAINAAYWLLAMAIAGGIVAAFH